MDEDEAFFNPYNRSYRPPRQGPQHRGRGRGRGGERGAMSMESLNMSSNWRQNSGNRAGRRQHFYGQEGRRQDTGGQDGRRQTSADRDGWQPRPYGNKDGRGCEQDEPSGENRYYGSRGGRRGTFPPRGGSRQTRGPSNNPRGEGKDSHFHNSRNKQRERPVGNRELERLTTLQPDLVVFELLSEKSGFPLLIEEGNFTPYKMELTVKVLARVTATQSNRDNMYQLLNKTCTDNFVFKLMNHALTLKREYPEKGPVFFAELHTLLETFASGMTSIAIKRLVNLVDGCHSALVTMEADGFVENSLVKKYKALMDFLTEEGKKRAQEEKMDSQERKRKREAEMNNMEPPDDFREMSVLPTQMDITDTNRPFLRKNLVSGCYADGQHYLDVQFRLLREDFVRPLRIGISQFRSNTKSRIMDVRIYRNVTYIDCKVERRRLFHEVQLGSMKRMKLENSKRLIYGNLVCISNDNFSTMVLGSVADRTPEKIRQGIIGIEFESDIRNFDTSSQFTMIESRAYFVAYKHVLQALKEMPENIPMEKYVVQVEALIDPPQYLAPEETYDLRVMKSSSLMRRAEAVIRLNRLRRGHDQYEDEDEDEEDQHEDVNTTPESRRLQRVQVTRTLLDWPSEAELGLDSSQRRALRSALTRELAIIQGPPGTGKTFIGLKIVQILLHNSLVWKTKENPTPILVVCFTNHALDQFLEGMTTFTKSIVRVGSRTQSEKIDEFQINKLVRSVVSSRSLPQNIYDNKSNLTNELKILENNVHELEVVDYECGAARGILHLSALADNIIPDHIFQQLHQAPDEKVLTHWLTQSYHAPGTTSRLLWQQPSDSTVQGRPSQEQLPGAKEDSDVDEEVFHDAEELIETEERERKLDDDTDEPVSGWDTRVNFEVTKKELEGTLNLLLQRAEDGDEDAFLNHMIISGKLEAIKIGLDIPVNCQDMEALEAVPQLNIWHLEPRLRWQLYNHWLAKLQRRAKAARAKITAELLRKVKTYEEVRNAEYLHTMRRAAIVGMTTTGAAQYNSILRDLAPAIVVIEEAAEILESHVITSLTANCQHLIMIGDHQQLQPSATVYELATKYGLETSLFERMIKNGLAFETLEYQHRMRPEISQLLVPSIYPTLKDHPSVQDYPRVLGMVHNVFFLSHQEHERAESDDNNSHENQHEAELIMGLCRHLMLQGYSPQEVTILTTYSGQFFLLRKLQRQYPECTGVRVAVVDNFQGEENKIILLSLVRSNPEGNAGFLRRDNRVCVALSRAKHGLYITGNMGLLSESSSLWKKINGDLVQSGSLGLAFTLRCENHPDQVVTVATGADFLAKSPEGGCVQVCAKPLPNCRHSCPRVCHMDDPEHEEYKCRVPCPKTLCSLDHKCPKLCHEICGPCMVILPKPLPCGHTHRIPCHVAPESHKCPTMVEKKIPACEHMVTMPCHHNPSTFTCPEDCDTRVPCGHKCRKKCHRTEDPDHLEYSCQEACTKINVGCTQKHPCHKKCYQECGACVVMVDKKLPCGHEQKDVECSQPAEKILCKKYCKKTLPCGHKCKRLCFKECGDCQVPVKKVVEACGHSIRTACSDPATTDKCDGPCPKTLPCGHPCRAKCKDACTPKCPELVYSGNTCPKGHVIELPCHLNTKVVGEAAWGFCNAPCDKKLDCGHQCVGTCGRCLHGRLHLDCNKPCKRPLVCGHICKYPCSATCPPCQEKCQWKCSHSQCRQLCGRLCQPCKEMCEVGCKHKKCTKRCGDSCKWRCKQHKEGDGECGEDCSRKPCQEPCKEKLKCGHECVGFCGDPCPPLCRECDHDELTEFVLLGNEDEPDARFVWLEDCGHCIEVEGLEGWLQQEDTAVGMKTCPKCRTTIYNNRRYQNIVLQTHKAVLAIKKKYYQAQNNIKMRDIELILQDEEILHCFRSECLMLLKKIGVGPRKKGRPFVDFSVGEKTLCHFQAQVLKKATSILNQKQTADSTPSVPLRATSGPASKHLAVLRPLVEAVVAGVMEKTTTITPQMEREVSCELQRLAVLPAYRTFQEKSAVYQNTSMAAIKAKLEALMNPTVIFDEELDKKVRALLKESEKYVGGLGISDKEKMLILKAMGLRQGHWYKCPNGHIYCITECGGAMVESDCPECGSRIGGGSHRLRGDNAVATEMDGANHAAWSEHNNMGNFDLNI
ncbi:NFX1-type zinc finger-containing protein 1-like [Eriocheir sinensis]|uniref:NFX1-type zinc finger-containing protein 1-like n=1 Tax=Eriocheir sinensis TaxID=95602 RepID=UPI0021CAA178|nr:NFX1-type zinc finger-containing protein 1-like [Eriocheir sinensis]